MLSDPELSALLDQARRNLDTLQLLVRPGGGSEWVPLQVMRQRLQDLKLAYTSETDALTRQVLSAPWNGGRCPTGAARRNLFQPPPTGRDTRSDDLRRRVRGVRVVDVKLPDVIAEETIEPDDVRLGRAWHALDESAFARGAARRQSRWRSGTVAHVRKCRGR
jgi:hypothetical protein